MGLNFKNDTNHKIVQNKMRDKTWGNF